MGLGYDNANRRTSLSYPNGTNTSYTYDVASRLTNINHLGPGGLIEALTYQYDAAGNRTSLTRNNAAASLLPAAVASASYDAANEQVAFAGATLTYDNNGNLTNDGVNIYQWDARNRLIGMSGGTTASFRYDALGRRVSKTLSTQSPALSTAFLYDRNDIAAEIGGGAIGANYVRSLNIDEPFIRQSGSGNEFYHTDALGSSLALSNGQGAPATTYGYEPFGKTTVTGTSANPFQYTGRENDGTGLFYYRARYYYPKVHRFGSEDPIGFSGGINTYVYVLDNPLKYSDPTGKDVWVGGEGTAGIHVGPSGASVGGGVLTNPGTGETCTFTIVCGRVGLGIYVGAGGKFIGSILAPRCGKDVGGFSVQLGGDIIAPGFGGVGGSVGGGGGVGGGVSVGPEGGAGISVGADVCYVKIQGCMFTPPDCKKCGP